MPLPFFAIAPVQLAAAHAAKMQATKALSILDPDQACPEFQVEHLLLRFHDVSHGVGGPRWIEPPLGGHVAKIIAFAQSLAPHDRVLVHCAMGISRSPAAVLIIVAALTGSADAAIEELRRLIPSLIFEPNQRMIRLADRQLRMKGALEAVLNVPPRPIPDAASIW